MYMKRAQQQSAHLLLQTVDRGHSDLVVVLAKVTHVLVVVVVIIVALRKLGQNFDSDGVVVLVTAICVSLPESARVDSASSFFRGADHSSSCGLLLLLLLLFLLEFELELLEVELLELVAEPAVRLTTHVTSSRCC